MTTVLTPLQKGLRQVCPKCGEGKLFDGLLALVKQCDHCGVNLKAADPGDGPAFFTITVMSFLVVVLAVIVELKAEPSFWLHLAIWPVVIIFGSVGLLRVFKAWLIAVQWQHGAAGFEESDNDG